jgi:hypothetical protein
VFEGAYLEFTPGNTYKFDQSDSSNANHPLRFYEDAAKATAYTTGVTTNGTPGSSGAYTQIIPTTDTPPVLFYQCSAHSLMGSYVKFGTGTVGDTYSIGVTQDGNNVDLKLDANSGTDSTVQLTAGSNVTLTRNDAQQVTIASTASGGISGITVQEEGSPLSTAAPVKFNVVAAVENGDPSACTVIPLIPPEAVDAIVTCCASFLVSVTFEPAVSCTVESVPLFASNFKSTSLPSCVTFMEYVSPIVPVPNLT